jgi:sugar lactone lactonase YvrE
VVAPALDEMSVYPWSPAPGILSEGPRWHGEAGELLWVDILGSKMHRARVTDDVDPGAMTTLAVDRHVGAVAPAVGGGYVLAAATGFLFLDEDGAIREMAQPEEGHTDVRMNDGACDRSGRFWAGTMAYDESPGAGVLYRLELDATCTRVLTGLSISNGIGWSPDNTVLYLADSGTRTVDAFSYDESSGNLGAKRTLVHIDEPGVVPDGLTVDTDGGLWVALWGGGAVRRYSPDGQLLLTVELPVDRPTSCAFGGPGEASLFVTTARVGLDERTLRRQPHAGRVFRIDGLGVRGEPCQPYRGAVPRR